MSIDPTFHFASAQSDDFVRLPGLFRRWELEDVIDLDADFHFEDAGKTDDGTPLVSVYRRPHTATDSTELRHGV
jgi:hypothetical protein